jgi:hypothetical protein
LFVAPASEHPLSICIIPLELPELLPLPPLLDPPLETPLLDPPLEPPEEPPLPPPFEEPPLPPLDDPLPELPPFEDAPLSSPPNAPRSPPWGEELHPYAANDAATAEIANQAVFFICGLGGSLGACREMRSERVVFGLFCGSSAIGTDSAAHVPSHAGDPLDASQRMFFRSSDASSATVQDSANVQVTSTCASSAQQCAACANVCTNGRRLRRTLGWKVTLNVDL